MENKEIEELLKTEKTPLYVFDLKELKNRIGFLKRQLPDNVEICYAVKANTFIVEEAEKWVDWLEICSPGEYQICKKTGLPSEKFVISGVNKDSRHIEELVANQRNIGYYTVESVNQFFVLREAAKKNSKRIDLLLRLTSGNQFGLDETELERLISEYGQDDFVQICGIQFFSGTQKNSIKKLKRELNYLDDFIEGLYEKYGFTTKKLEFGPGFPVSYFEGENFDEEEFLKLFSDILCTIKYKGKVSLELGRSIAASCGTYLTRVIDTKCNHSEKYAIIDGGVHQIVYYGQFMAMKHPKIRCLSSHEGNDVTEWNICGSLCTVNDILVKRFPIENLEIGDVLIFEKVGAYCVTEGIALFLSRDIPQVVLQNEDRSFKIVRESIKTEIFNM